MTHLDPDLLALAAMNELDLPPGAREHLVECADCSNELTELRRTVAAARSAATVELLQPADAVWGRIHDDLGLSDAVAAPPRVEDATGDAGAAADTADTDEPRAPDDPDEPDGAADTAASVTPRTPRTTRSQGTMAFAAYAGLICLVGGIAGEAWRRPRPRAAVPAIA